MSIFKIVVLLMAGLMSLHSHAKDLVTPETVAIQKKLTKTTVLANGMKLVYRQIKNSEIAELSLNYPFGTAHLPSNQKGFGQLLFSLMGRAAEGYPKAKIYQILEKFSGGIGCQTGIELSHCSLSAVNDYWDELLPVFVAITQSPSYPQKDLNNMKQAALAQLESQSQEPGDFVNDVINRVYYPDNHPYKLTMTAKKAQVSRVKRGDLLRLHRSVKNRRGQFLTYVGSMPLSKVKKDLDEVLGKISLKDYPAIKVPQPSFNGKNAFIIEDRPIPTAYMNIKFNAPGRTKNDALASKLMLRILSEELGLEIRTKKSLSYAVYSYMISHNIGIGLISATTSKPEQTLKAISKIVTKLKTKKYSAEELGRYKNIYTTRYFLTLETHNALRSALAANYYHFQSLDPFYEQPLRLSHVTADMIQDMAKKYLVNFRVGVIFKKAEFKDAWAHQLIDGHKA